MESSGCDANQGSEALSPGKRELAPEIQGPTQLRLGRAQLKRTEMVGGYAGEVIAGGLSAEQKTAGWLADESRRVAGGGRLGQTARFVRLWLSDNHNREHDCDKRNARQH
jgi:hypothetical protein